MKKPERMTKLSKARKVAKRQLTKRVKRKRKKLLAATLKSKRRPPRWLQRQRRLEAKEKQKQLDQRAHQVLAAMLKPRVAERKRMAPIYLTHPKETDNEN